MKKIILSFFFLILLIVWNNVFAEKTTQDIDKEIKALEEQLSNTPQDSVSTRIRQDISDLEAEKAKASNTNSEVTPIKVKVTEKVPWGNCTWDDEKWYECRIKPWFKSVQAIIWNIIKWFTAICALSWVLFIVINWIMLSTGTDTSEVKKRIVKWIIWLVLVLLSWVILNMIAPWVYK